MGKSLENSNTLTVRQRTKCGIKAEKEKQKMSKGIKWYNKGVSLLSDNPVLGIGGWNINVSYNSESVLYRFMVGGLLDI